MGTRRAVFFAIAIAIASCTFPDVDYADGGATGGGSGGSGGSACAAPLTCANTATNCATMANKKHDACVKGCKPNNEACVPNCDQTFKTVLGMCAAVCVSCSQPDCKDVKASCDALVGL